MPPSRASTRRRSAEVHREQSRDQRVVAVASNSERRSEGDRLVADTIPRKGALEPLSGVVIRIAGDSGDGMQLTGDRFTTSSALLGNDLSTLPDFPAEIRAPAGTVHGVSAFQVHISDHDIATPGDAPDVLVVMNPAALKAELARLRQGGTVIVNVDNFEERSLKKAGYEVNPLEDDTLAGYQVYEIPMTSLT